MPGQIGPHRGHRHAGHALAQGVVAAYRHRHTIAKVARKASHVVRKSFTKRTVTKKVIKKHDQPDIGVGAEFTKMSLSYGKIVKHNLPKLLLASIKSVTGRQYWVNQFDNPASATTLPGAIGLNNFQLNGAGNIAMPLHLIDISSWMNTKAGLLSYSQPLFTMVTDTSGNVTFAQDSKAWFIEQGADRISDVAMQTRESDLLKTVTAKFLFYGATGKPTKFSIDLISIYDDSLHPDTNISMTANSGENVSLWDGKSAFWTSMVRPMLWNPLIMGDSKVTSGHKYKVHQHSEFLLQEKLSNEPSSFSGHMKQVNYQLNLDKIQRYDWNNKFVTPPSSTEGVGIYPETNDLSTVVAPKRRLYLMIRAQSTFNTGASFDPSKSPSYDLVLRSKHESVV